MSWATAKTALKMFDVAILGLEKIQAITGTGGIAAAEALQAVDAIVQSVLAGFADKATPEAVASAIQTIHDQIAANDAAIDAEIDKKFDKGDTTP